MSQSLTSQQLTEIRRVKAMVAALGTSVNPDCFMGPRGFKGDTGATGPVAPSKNLLVFTLYLEYGAGTTISAIYYPPGLFQAPFEKGGRTTRNLVDENNNSYLIFKNTDAYQITLGYTAYPKVSGIYCSAYFYDENINNRGWQPTPLIKIGGGGGNTLISYIEANNNNVRLINLSLGNLNGGSIVPAPPGGSLAGYHATVSLNYIPNVSPDQTLFGDIISYSIYYTYDNFGNINKVFIPPKLFKQTTGLAAGGIFTQNQGSYLIFKGLNSPPNTDINISLSDTSYPQIYGFSIVRYTNSSVWTPLGSTSYGNIGNRTSYISQSDGNVTIRNLDSSIITSGNTSVDTNPGLLNGYTVAITLYYLPI